jgi:hypothetical protein
VPRRRGKTADASAIHCSLDERAFTDLITNATQFSGIALDRDIRRIMTPGGFPRESLPSVLHESVHHWCFMTPVMCALALLDTRSRMRSIDWAMTDDDSVAARAFDDHLRYEACTLALRPLAEGLAQFFEYDVMPYPQTPIASHPTLWANAFFTGARDSEGKWGMELLKVLGEARIGETMIRRKTNLLLQPLDCSKGGYLPGYLTVKNLWRACRDKNRAFYDADLFAALMRRYFYNDYGFVDFILDTSVSGPEWLAGLVDYIGNRVNGLLRLDLEEAEATLIETGLNPPERLVGEGWMRLTHYPPMDTDPEKSKAGVRRLDELIASLHESFASSFQMMPIAYRHLLWLGQTKVEIRPAANGKLAVLAAGDQLFEAELVTPADKIPKSGQMDVYVSTYEYFLGAIISTGSNPIGTVVHGKVDDETAKRFRDLPANRVAMESQQKKLTESYTILANTFRIRELHEKLLGYVLQLIEDIYRPGALLCVPRESRASVAKLMRKDGVLGVLDGDLRLLKSAAALSLAAALRMRPEEVKNEIPAFYGEVDKVLEALNQHSNRADFPVVFGKEGYELGSYV